MSQAVEQVDLVNDQGQIKYLGIPRSDAHIHPDLYVQIVVVVLWDKQGRVLVQQRALSKISEPGRIDLVCGAILSGETPIQAALRETREETKLIPTKLIRLQEGLNQYGRWRHLFRGQAEGLPTSDPRETEWIRFQTPDQLRYQRQTGELTFVKDFFKDLNLAAPPALK